MLSGSVGDYDAAAQTAIKTVLAAEADVATSAVSLTLTAGSVMVNADVFFGTQAGAASGASRLSTGVVASATSLETALNAQFAADGLGVTTTVQELLAAPQAVAVGESTGLFLGIGFGAGGLVLLFIIVLVIVVRRARRVAPSQQQELGPSTRRVTPEQEQELELGPLPQAMPVPMGTAVEDSSPSWLGGLWMETAVMGTVVEERTVVEDSSPSSATQLTLLPEQVEFLKRQLGLSGNMKDVVHQAAEQLGIDPAGKPLKALAAMCMQGVGVVA